MTLMQNWDQDEDLKVYGGAPNTMAAAVFDFTIDGIPMLFNGEEVGNDNSNVNPHTVIDWSSPNAATFQPFYKSLLALRNSSSALQQGTVTWIRTRAARASSLHPLRRDRDVPRPHQLLRKLGRRHRVCRVRERMDRRLAGRLPRWPSSSRPLGVHARGLRLRGLSREVDVAAFRPSVGRERITAASRRRGALRCGMLGGRPERDETLGKGSAMASIGGSWGGSGARAFAALGALGLLSCGSTTAAPLGTTTTVKLVQNPWDASRLDVAIADVLLTEQLGMTVTVTELDEYSQWQYFVTGDEHACLEVWPSGHMADIANYIQTGKVEDGGLLGPVGKSPGTCRRTCSPGIRP